MYKDNTVCAILLHSFPNADRQAPFSLAFRATAVTSLMRVQRANLKSAAI